MEHGSTFCATLQFSISYLYQKRIIAPKIFPNFGIFYQNLLLDVHWNFHQIWEPKFHSKLHILSLEYLHHSSYEIFCTKSGPTLIICKSVTNRSIDFKTAGIYNSAFCISIQKIKKC